jgi:hypothetical protein
VAAAGATGLAGYYGAVPAYNYVKDYAYNNPAQALGAAGAAYYGANPSQIVPHAASVISAGANVASTAIPAAVTGLSGLATYMGGESVPDAEPVNTYDAPQSYPTSMDPDYWNDPVGSGWDSGNSHNIDWNNSLNFSNTFQSTPTFTTKFDAYIGGY